MRTLVTFFAGLALYAAVLAPADAEQGKRRDAATCQKMIRENPAYAYGMRISSEAFKAAMKRCIRGEAI